MNADRPWAAPRDQTRVALLGLIRQARSMTRSELMTATGFSRSTVGHAVNQLIESGLVEEGEFAGKGPGSGRGRPGTTLRPVAAGGHVAAIDFGHRHVTVAVADGAGSEVARRRLDVGIDAIEKLDAATSALETLRIANHIARIHQVVAGIPKPLNHQTGLVQAPKVSDGWSGLSPAAELTHRTGIPTHAENDALLGAIGEHSRGAAREFGDFLYVKVAHGVGSSVFLNGNAYRGVTGIVGNIGHCRLDGHTELCRCGNRGCLEAVCSIGPVWNQLASTHPGADPSAVLAEMDDTAARVLNGAGRALGRVLADFCNLLTPSAVILGGSMGSQYEPFREGVEWAVREFAGPAIATTTEVLQASLGSSAELLGGLTLAAELLADRSFTSQV